MANPTRYLDAEKQLELIIMTLGEPDASGRRRPVPLENSEFLLPADRVILAIGQVLDETSLRPEAVSGQNGPGESLLPLDGGWIQADPKPATRSRGLCRRLCRGPATVVKRWPRAELPPCH